MINTKIIEFNDIIDAKNIDVYKRQIFKLGFLDGKEGFIYHYMYQRWYRCLVDAKIYEHLKTNASFEKTGDLKSY